MPHSDLFISCPVLLTLTVFYLQALQSAYISITGDLSMTLSVGSINGSVGPLNL